MGQRRKWNLPVGGLIAIGMKERGCTGGLVDGGGEGYPLDRGLGFHCLRALPLTHPVHRLLEGQCLAMPGLP